MEAPSSSPTAYLDALQRLRAAGRRPSDEPARTHLDLAVGLLAGRVGCSLAEAQAHIAEMVVSRQRSLDEIAIRLIELLGTPPPGGPQSSLTDVGAVLRVEPANRGPGVAVPNAPAVDDPARVQQVLEVVPGAVTLWAPVRDESGAIVDYVVEAASPEAVDVLGRRGRQLVGARVVPTYPSIVGSERWRIYERVLDTGRGSQVPPFAYVGESEDIPVDTHYSTKAYRLGGKLVISWIAHEDETRRVDRLRQTERLGNLGWGEWDLRTGHVEWSDQMYGIYGRDPADGPIALSGLDPFVVEADQPIRAGAFEALERGERTDITYRIRVGGEIKYLRAVADGVRDTAGQLIKIYGITQDVTVRETARSRVAEVERRLEEQQRTLDAEHRLASQLQTIILPIPAEPINLPGLRVALRYLPAEHLSHVGGDWYHAAALPDSTVLLAVGDVAGHGIRAATTMAQLRHALRALTVTTTDPAQLISHLNRLMCDLSGELAENRSGETSTATAVIARYDSAKRTLTWTHAGHPVPLLSHRGVTGPLAPLPQPPGLLLGVRSDAVYGCSTVTLELGDVLLLYTDGLVEHRRQGLEEGMASVISTVDDAISSSPHQPLSALLARLRRANPEDDTCVLAARPLATQDQS
jgi:serine phosphatase RsbU (regulator of sigma subunit)/PAS domain-containing protein